MKVGIDRSSIDQASLTLSYFKDYEVEYVNMSYNSLKSAIKSKKIDSAIWNKDDIVDDEVEVIDISKEQIGISDTEAVIITANKILYYLNFFLRT